MSAPAANSAGPPWVEILLAAIGLVGGASGLTATTVALLRRHKLRAGLAAALADSTLTLVRPLKARVRDLKLETLTAGEQVEAASREVTELRTRAQHATKIMREWSGAILDPNATVDQIRSIVAGSEPSRRGLPGGEEPGQPPSRRSFCGLRGQLDGRRRRQGRS